MTRERECRELLEVCLSVQRELVDEMIAEGVSGELVHKAGWVLSEISGHLRENQQVSGEK